LEQKLCIAKRNNKNFEQIDEVQRIAQLRLKKKRIAQSRSIGQKCLVKLEEEEEDAHNINARCTKMNWRYQLNLNFFGTVGMGRGW